MSVGKGDVLSTVYKWEIANYSAHTHLETGKSITSPTFYAGDSAWYLELYPNGDNEDGKGSISLFLGLKKTKPDNAEIRFAFSLINAKNEIMAHYDSEEIILFIAKNKIWGVSFTNTNNADIKVLDKIMILCEIIVEKAKFYKTILTSNSDRLKHFEGYKNLLKNPKFSDVKFTVECQEIPAHKNVLAASTPVFAAMFEHEMQENISNNVIIEDFSYKVFNELLTFLYTGECTISQDIVLELFEAADKYQLLKLKDMCEEELCENISAENTIALLQLADMHSAERLKKKAVEFVTLHGKDIVHRPEFDSMRSLQPNIFREVFEKIFDHITI